MNPSSEIVTLHHEMTRNEPDGHFHVFIFSESKFFAIYNGENHFQIRTSGRSYMFLNMAVRHKIGTFGKTCFKC